MAGTIQAVVVVVREVVSSRKRWAPVVEWGGGPGKRCLDSKDGGGVIGGPGELLPRRLPTLSTIEETFLIPCSRRFGPALDEVFGCLDPS